MSDPMHFGRMLTCAHICACRGPSPNAPPDCALPSPSPVHGVLLLLWLLGWCTDNATPATVDRRSRRQGSIGTGISGCSAWGHFLRRGRYSACRRGWAARAALCATAATEAVQQAGASCLQTLDVGKDIATILPGCTAWRKCGQHAHNSSMGSVGAHQHIDS